MTCSFNFRTLCGTPNYIAPEMLGKKGHSYEVDIWAIGCILYTLLVGKPPFETQSLKDTYARIKNNEYIIPTKISANARHLIQRLLQPDPQKRPTINEVLQFDFFTQGMRMCCLLFALMKIFFCFRIYAYSITDILLDHGAEIPGGSIFSTWFVAAKTSE